LPEEIDFSTAQPLWGIIGSSNSTPADYVSIDNTSTILQESLYLPGYMDQYYFNYDFSQSGMSSLGQNLPGVDFYFQALATALRISSPCVTTDSGFADYSGMTSLALFAKWQNLSRNADTVSTILNFVWTDAAANSIAGTKGWGLTSGTNQQVLVPVTVYRKVILYRLPFAIPAFIVLAAAIAVLVTLILLTLTRKTGLGRMRALLEATSAGRIIGMSLWPEKRTGRGTKEWIAAVGTRSVSITNEGIVAEGESLVEEAEEESGIEHRDGATFGVSETKAIDISETQRPRTRTMDANLYREVPLKDEPVVRLSPSATVRRKALPEPSEH
jgi:hypothetical protein